MLSSDGCDAELATPLLRLAIMLACFGNFGGGSGERGRDRCDLIHRTVYLDPSCRILSIKQRICGKLKADRERGSEDRRLGIYGQIVFGGTRSASDCLSQLFQLCQLVMKAI